MAAKGLDMLGAELVGSSFGRRQISQRFSENPSDMAAK